MVNGASKPENSKQSIREIGQLGRISEFIRPYRFRLIIGLIIITIGSLLGLAGPYTLQFLVDAVFKKNDPGMLNRITLILIGIFLLQSVTYFFRSYLLAFVGERVMADLRIRLFEKLESLSLSYFNERRTGELVSRLTNDVSTVRNLVTSDVSTALSQVLTFIGALVLIIVTDWRLTLFMFALIPVVVVIALFFGRKLRAVSARVQDELAMATAILEEGIGGIRVVQSFTRENHEIQRFRQAIGATFALAMRRARISSVFGPIISFAGFAAVVSIFWFGGHEVLAGRLTAGQLFMFLVLTLTIAASIGQFGGLWASIQETLGATRRLFEILDTHSDLLELPGAEQLERVEGRIDFEEVAFAYHDDPETPILAGINLTVQPGEMLALVGPSGAGKTTLVNLIPRFFDPSSGRICIDGRDLRALQVKSLREQIGIVPQETLLFGGSVRENILYGRLEASEAEIVEAARSANAHAFIQQLPEGYDTLVGERGVKLSGGQRQRIAIARAILKDPCILLLDEATSSLDSESEGLVQDALERLMHGRTSIVIAHRLSTIQNAQRIAVLEAGRLVELGSHAELMALEGLYARLHRLQFKVEEVPARTPDDAEERPEGAPKPSRRRGMGFLGNIGMD